MLFTRGFQFLLLFVIAMKHPVRLCQFVLSNAILFTQNGPANFVAFH